MGRATWWSAGTGCWGRRRAPVYLFAAGAGFRRGRRPARPGPRVAPTVTPFRILGRALRSAAAARSPSRDKNVDADRYRDIAHRLPAGTRAQIATSSGPGSRSRRRVAHRPREPRVPAPSTDMKRSPTSIGSVVAAGERTAPRRVVRKYILGAPLDAFWRRQDLRAQPGRGTSGADRGSRARLRVFGGLGPRAICAGASIHAPHVRPTDSLKDGRHRRPRNRMLPAELRRRGRGRAIAPQHRLHRRTPVHGGECHVHRRGGRGVQVGADVTARRLPSTGTARTTSVMFSPPGRVRIRVGCNSPAYGGNQRRQELAPHRVRRRLWRDSPPSPSPGPLKRPRSSRVTAAGPARTTSSVCSPIGQHWRSETATVSSVSRCRPRNASQLEARSRSTGVVPRREGLFDSSFLNPGIAECHAPARDRRARHG